MHVTEQVRRLVIAAVGETEAANIDLDRVTRHIGQKDLTIGDSHFDGCLTVSPLDTVTIWAQGRPHSNDNVPGAYEHFRDVYDTTRILINTSPVANRAPSVHRYTVDIAVPAGVNPDGALNRALAQMSGEAGCPNRVHARKQPDGTVVTDIDAAPDAP